MSGIRTRALLFNSGDYLNPNSKPEATKPEEIEETEKAENIVANFDLVTISILLLVLIVFSGK